MIQDLNEISDGKVYGLKDMVRAACNDCAGCYACCEGMGDSIVLDPYDVWQLQRGTGMGFEQLLAQAIELGVEDGVVLPHLKMQEETDKCFFLDGAGRCSIHANRPGLCRVFPLGRIYEDSQIKYFLQPNACQKTNRSKVKVIKWLDTPEQKKNETFLMAWHDLRKQFAAQVQSTEDEKEKSNLNLFLLKQFYVKPYDLDGDFYEQFWQRMEEEKGRK